MIIKPIQDTLLQALLWVKKIKVKVKLSLSSLFDELASNKPTVTNPNIEQVEAELNLETATASTTEIQEAHSKLKRSKSLIHKCTKELDHYVALPLITRGGGKRHRRPYHSWVIFKHTTFIRREWEAL